MATRGHIAIKENGKYKYIYNHWDSDIDQLGVTLFKFYKDADKVRALIDLGDVSSVGEKIENQETKIIHLVIEMFVGVKTKINGLYSYKSTKRIKF